MCEASPIAGITLANTQTIYMLQIAVLNAEFRHTITTDRDGLSVAYDDQKGNNKERVVQRYSNYLNGPMGKNVMENVDEGESFTLETPKYLLRVTKIRGKAIVDIIKQLP
ncbi:MAG: hypothetical protein ACW960_11620 [Candidatus Thorarchaeota archaeon]|jgi:hypothetical protein